MTHQKPRLLIPLIALSFAIQACSNLGKPPALDSAPTIDILESARQTLAAQASSTPVTTSTETESATESHPPAETQASTERPSPTETQGSSEGPQIQDTQPAEAPAETASPIEGAAASDACYHPYFPTIEGPVWRYRSTAPGAAPSEHNIRFESVTPDSFTVYQELENATSEIRWLCSPDGLIQSQYTYLNIKGMPVDFKFETIDYRGVTFPVADQWQVGATWDSGYTIAGIMSTDMGEMTTQMEIDQKNSLTAEEPVSVPAGSYPKAARVDSLVTMLISSQVAGVETPGAEITFTMSAWYVEGVGLVKSISREAGGEALIELLSMK